LVLSTDVYSARSFTKAETEDDDEFETMSRAAEAMTLSETGLPSVHFGYLSPIPAADRSESAPKGVALPPGVRLLLGEWDIGTDPDQYVYRDPYDEQPVATSQATPMMAPPVIAYSRAAPVVSSSQPLSSHLAGDIAGPDIHTDSFSHLASTQVLPGPFGARLPTGKKKAAGGKKRVGGF
jgi:hypothetical protein